MSNQPIKSIDQPVSQIKAAAVDAGDLGEVAQHSTKEQGTLSFGQKIKTLAARDVSARFVFCGCLLLSRYSCYTVYFYVRV